MRRSASNAPLSRAASPGSDTSWSTYPSRRSRRTRSRASTSAGGDKTKRFLSDAEVAALIRRRDGWQASAERQLAEFAETDPFPRPEYPHLFILAQPVSQNPELFRELVGGSDYAARVLKLMYDVGRMAPARSEIAGMTDLSKTADGVMVVPGDLRGIDPAAFEKWTRRFEIREDGGLRFFNSHVGDWSNGPASDRILGLHLGSSWQRSARSWL
jgi:hypothetical protein